jgi:hypothetical protein
MGKIILNLQVEKLKLGKFQGRDQTRTLTPNSEKSKVLDGPKLRSLALKRSKRKKNLTR